MSKAELPEQRLEALLAGLRLSQHQWQHLKEHGGRDPFWPDGANMNLERHHIIAYKRDIREHCQRYGLTVPEECYIPTPPEVDEQYMAELGTDRAEKLRAFHGKLNHSDLSYDEEQTELV